MARVHGVQAGIALQKKYGQHFLRDQNVVDHMLERVTLTPQTSVIEIGCGDGFLTRSILQTPVARLLVYEIDASWADYVRKQYPDERMTIKQEDILCADFDMIKSHAPWTLLSNLPYQITFPILYRLQEYRHLFVEGVVMVQEEVAQKIVQTTGRGYGFTSLFFQHYFTWELLDKIPPTAFYPPPKVYSRLLYFKPRERPEQIPDEAHFWQFIKLCFRQPRRTLKNNLAQTQYMKKAIPEELLALRAQQMSKEQFLQLWHLLTRLS